MLKVKEIRKDGKYLKIIIKKPYFTKTLEFMKKNIKIFNSYDDIDDMCNFNWGLTSKGDIELEFTLRNYDDIKPYVKFKDKGV